MDGKAPPTTHLDFEAIEYKLRLTGKGTKVESEGWTPNLESIFAASLWLQNWNWSCCGFPLDLYGKDKMELYHEIS